MTVNVTLNKTGFASEQSQDLIWQIQKLFTGSTVFALKERELTE